MPTNVAMLSYKQDFDREWKMGVGHAAMTFPDLSLTGQVALVTGASRGIGRAIALGLANAGADIALAARSQSSLERVALEIEALGRRAQITILDVQGSRAVITNEIKAIAGKLGRCACQANMPMPKPACTRISGATMTRAWADTCKPIPLAWLVGRTSMAMPMLIRCRMSIGMESWLSSRRLSGPLVLPG